MSAVGFRGIHIAPGVVHARVGMQQILDPEEGVTGLVRLTMTIRSAQGYCEVKLCIPWQALWPPMSVPIHAIGAQYAGSADCHVTAAIRSGEEFHLRLSDGRLYTERWRINTVIFRLKAMNEHVAIHTEVGSDLPIADRGMLRFQYRLAYDYIIGNPLIYQMRQSDLWGEEPVEIAALSESGGAELEVSPIELIEHLPSRTDGFM